MRFIWRVSGDDIMAGDAVSGAPPHACGAGKPYVLHFPASAAWIFGDTALKSGDRFSLAGIEID
ncbi:MAG: hypothetical protein ACJ74V_02010, partial [Gaiellaceae bacterium]